MGHMFGVGYFLLAVMAARSEIHNKSTYYNKPISIALFREGVGGVISKKNNWLHDPMSIRFMNLNISHVSHLTHIIAQVLRFPGNR